MLPPPATPYTNPGSAPGGWRVIRHTASNRFHYIITTYPSLHARNTERSHGDQQTVRYAYSLKTCCIETNESTLYKEV